MTQPHDFDARTFFCLRCGMAMQLAYETKRTCIVDATNVVAISHIVSGRRLRALMRELKG